MARNWILECLEEGRLWLARQDDSKPIAYDRANHTAISATVDAARSAGRHSVLLPSPSLPTPLFAGLAVAYELLSGRARGVSVLVTQAPRILEMVRRVAIHDPAGDVLPINDNFPIGVIKNNVLSRTAFIRTGISPTRFRLVVAEKFRLEDLEVLGENGIPVKAILFDGRTRKPDLSFRPGPDIEAVEDGVSLVLLSPSRYFRVDGWPSPDLLPNEGSPAQVPEGSAPILVTPSPHTPELCAMRIELDTQPLLRALLRLRDVPNAVVRQFAFTGLRLYNTLLAAPVHPSELDPIYLGPGQEHVHPAAARIEMLRHALRAAVRDDLAESHAMRQVADRLQELVEALDKDSPKRATVIQLLHDIGEARILVADRSTREGLVLALEELELPGEVTAWTDPVTWPPEDRPVVMATPPPRYREWITTVNLGARVFMTFTPQEAARFRGALAKEGITGGPGFEALETLMGPPMQLNEADTERWNTELMDAGVLLSLAGTSELRRQTTGSTGSPVDPAQECDMIEIVLAHRGQVYRTRPGTKVAVLHHSEVHNVEAAHLEAGDLVILSSSSVDEDLQEAAFKAWENRPGNRRMRRLADGWKEPLVEQAEEGGWPAKRLRAMFRNEGVDLTLEQVRGTFHRLDIMAPLHKEEDVVRVSLKLSGIDPDPDRVAQCVDAIKRVRGIHRSAGRWVKQLGRTTYLEVDDDLVKEAQEVHDLDLEALRNHFFIDRIKELRGPVSLPGAFLGLQDDINPDEVPE